MVAVGRPPALDLRRMQSSSACEKASEAASAIPGSASIETRTTRGHDHDEGPDGSCCTYTLGFCKVPDQCPQGIPATPTIIRLAPCFRRGVRAYGPQPCQVVHESVGCATAVLAEVANVVRVL
eukprot:g68509.t1